ncbi:slipin family protein [Microbulbifer yueqingensis]|uniref:SPFH domain / Band 7 family protein n=1 Tax=Microbulbifer yueqingensis TaxID=658219 RepID=A0A1G9EJ53_9GAMM|nr:slipin family protein [Microbulbifer yueqingensis]SDK76207.1 SPFH domain / Band 7 family protein [Microbulbifer yueqingensis]
MMIWKSVDIADHERALLFRRNRFVGVLEPGRHRLLHLAGRATVEIHDISGVLFERPNAKFFLSTHAEKLAPYTETYELGDKQVGLLYRDGHLVDVLSPGTFLAVWKGVEKVRVDIIDISEEYTVDERLVSLLGRGSAAVPKASVESALLYVEVPNEHVGLLTVNGTLVRKLEPGSYGFWKYNRTIVVPLVDLRLQTVEVSGQEILTRDRVSLRINLSANYRVLDAERAALKLGNYAEYIYRELQLRLREAVGGNTLDALLEDKNSLNQGIATAAREKLAQYGIELATVGVKDIILPGDMKQILNQVVEAQKESEANLIKRREETQAMRSLHNTAKMMDNNPVLMRLKELEALERVTARIDKISVYGGLEGVLNNLVNLKPREASC